MALGIHSPLTDQPEIIQAIQSIEGVDVSTEDLEKGYGMLVVKGAREKINFVLKLRGVAHNSGWNLILYSNDPPEWEAPLNLKMEEEDAFVQFMRNLVSCLGAKTVQYEGKYITNADTYRL